MKIDFNSRQLQNIQHVAGGLNSLLLFLSGYYVGSNQWIKTIITIISYFILSRLSSEIFYRILKEVENEGNDNITLIENDNDNI